MLKEIFDLVKNAAGDSVINNPDVPHEENNDVVAEATHTVASGLRNMVAGGGLENILSMFTGGDKDKGGGFSLSSLTQNPLVQMMIGHLTGKLVSNYNMNSSQANNVASKLIPDVIGNLVSKANDPKDDSFSLDKLIGSITGGKSTEVLKQDSSGGGGLLQELVGSLAGGSNSGGLMEMVSKLTSGSSGRSGSGGLMDIISQLAGGAQEQQKKNGSGTLMDLIKGFTK